MKNEENGEWDEYKEERKRKKLENRKKSLKILESMGIEWVCLSESGEHYRIGRFDFWPTTGKYFDRKSGKTGRGVFHLVELVKKGI